MGQGGRSGKRCGRAVWLLLACLLMGPAALPGQVLRLPDRPAGAESGSAFARRIEPLGLTEREREVCSQVMAGNVPDFLRRLSPVPVTNSVAGNTNWAVFYAAADYLAIGSDQDYLLMPLSPGTAQKLANRLGCTLPTPKMVDAIYAAAEVKLAPSPIPPSPSMTTVPVFRKHNAAVRTQRAERQSQFPLGALVAGHKKDVVISARLKDAPGKVAIYGWHRTNGTPIQPLYLGHTAAWVDYSQCIRLVQQDILVNGRHRQVSEVLADPDLAGLLSSEGPVAAPRYPVESQDAARKGPSATEAVTEKPGEPFPAFQESSSFHERVASFTIEPGVRIHLNAPSQASLGPDGKALLIYYALPNGNTIEQTIGKVMRPGDDYRYDLQHIGAQTRFLRELLPDRPIFVAYLENNLKSWPAWRKQHGDQRIPEILARVKQAFADRQIETVLTGHSGGGSFIFGYLNALDSIPDGVVRIAFLDSNYAYDSARGHRDKLARWLRQSQRHSLCVLAYNDAVALLDGKSFVSAAGGTWGKSHEMQRDLAQDFTFTSSTNADFEQFAALNGRIQFLLKQNPERRILHTLQVERNGFIHALLTGTPHEKQGYEYFGPRAYSKWIQD